MKQYQYAKIPATKAMELGLDKIRKATSSGWYVINESDLITSGFPGQTFTDKVQFLGGTVLTAREAKQELTKKQ